MPAVLGSIKKLFTQFGLRSDVDKILVHGVGCTGGLAGLLRPAALLNTDQAWLGRV